MGWLDKFTGGAKPEKLSAKADVKGAPGTRIYHEYGVSEAPVNGKYQWTARVYAANGEAHNMTGSAESDREARIDAIQWAEDHKAKLRGIA